MEVYVNEIPSKNIHHSRSYKHSKLKLGVRVEGDGLDYTISVYSSN